jgi:hypothetical protein
MPSSGYTFRSAADRVLILGDAVDCTLTEPVVPQAVPDLIAGPGKGLWNSQMGGPKRRRIVGDRVRAPGSRGSCPSARQRSRP